MVCTEQGPYLTCHLEVTHSLIIHGTKTGKEKVNSLGIRLMLSHNLKRITLSHWKHRESRTLSSIPYVLTLANKEHLQSKS
ncbi:hypothetical protein U9M48_004395 [Paspalum notatum var. saurae]|uniref:Uncharacterized protein n=1 Tax=Paspalum notatum var. saurae TaxID=547442 RepID=A0AAQ3PMJ9_PASNO